MSTMRHAHPPTRPSPPLVRKTTAKATHCAPVPKSVLAPRITAKGAKAHKRAKEEGEKIFDEGNDEGNDDDMGSSFLQFCAMCEKQIVVPNSSILYCSESCRNRDAAIPTASPYLSHVSSPTKMAVPTVGGETEDPFGSKVPTYVPRLQPTPRTAPDGRIPAKFHDGKSDLDPTEWKPAEPSTKAEYSPPKSGDWKPKLTHRPSSEATSYLSKFHSSSDSLTSKRGPMIGRSRTTISSRSVPGLSHTPAASTSSEESLARTPYEFLARPALGIPTPSVAGASVCEGNDLTYEKKHVATSMGSASGSLKKLLGSTAEAM